jgi:hypothetical protein
MPYLTTKRAFHACCSDRGGDVVLGGDEIAGSLSLSGVCTHTLACGLQTASSMEILERDSSGAKGHFFEILPPLSCGSIYDPAAVVIDENESDKGQVLLLGGWDDTESSITVRKVDLATGVCTAQPSSLLCPQGRLVQDCMAGRLLDGRIVCVGTTHKSFTSDGSSEEPEEEEGLHTMAQVLEPPPHDSPSDASWQWRALPEASVLHSECAGCVLSDDRFANFGGKDASDAITSSCQALTLDADGARWDSIPPMHSPRRGCACAVIGKCVFVIGGVGSRADEVDEVYEEGLGRWRHLPCIRPHDSQVYRAGSALL